MSQSTHHLSDDTSDRLYTPEELDAFAAARGEKAHDWSRPAPQRAAHRGDVPTPTR